MAEPMTPEPQADCPVNPDPTSAVQTTCLLPDCPVHGMVLMAEPMTPQQRAEIREGLARAQQERDKAIRERDSLNRRLEVRWNELQAARQHQAWAEADLARAQQRIKVLPADVLRAAAAKARRISETTLQETEEGLDARVGIRSAAAWFENWASDPATVRALTGDGPDEGGITPQCRDENCQLCAGCSHSCHAEATP